MTSFTLRAQSFITMNVLGTILSTTIAFAGSSLIIPAFANGPSYNRPGDPVKEMNIVLPGMMVSDSMSINPTGKSPGEAEDASMVTCTCTGNLVQNPSFENGTTSWSWWNGALDAGTYAAQCGLNAGHFLEGGGAGNGGAYQDITGIAPGTSLAVYVFAGVHNAAYNANVAIEFYNGSSFISAVTQQVDAILPAMQLYTLDGTVPAGTTKVRCVFYTDQDWVKTDMWCMTATTCSAQITGLVFNQMSGGADITITNGGSYQQSAISGNYNLEAVVTTGSESAQFTVTGPTGGTNTENTEPYNYPGTGTTWYPAAGSYTVNVKLYSADNLGGALCDEATYSFTLLTCDNVTSGGTIGSSQVGCGVASYDPLPFTNITFPSGGSGTLEYMWLKSTASPCPAAGDASWQVIAGANLATYDAPAITQNTCFMRCSRRAGCSNWDGESNVLSVKLSGMMLSKTTKNVTCFGDNNGVIDLSVTGGNTPYTYDWSNDGAENPDNDPQDLYDLGPGTYTVTVTDAIGCTATLSATITSPPALSITLTPTSPSCFGGTNGSILVTVTNGTPPYNYAWWEGANSGSGAGINANPFTISNLPAGNYLVDVISGSCKANTYVTITQPPTINLTKVVTNASCGANNGAIDLTVSGGTSPYTYSWSNGATTEDISNLAAATYTVTVTDAHSCTRSLVATVTMSSTAPTLSTTQVNVLCNGASTGSIDLTVTGGTAPYTYIWSNSATTQDISNLAVGTYTVTVTTANGCTKTTSATITQPTAISLSKTQVNVLCNGASTGSITLTVSGGTSPYSYAWSNSATTQNISNLAAGTYTVTVTDAHSCTKTISATITQPTALSLSTTQVNVLCNGSSTGSITLTVSGGTSPYTYLWSNGATTQNTSNLAAATYTVTVTDANSCTKTTSATITQPTILALTKTQVNVLCNGSSTGSIDLTVTGGVSPYTYAWSNAATTQDLSNLAAGTYTVTVTDANSCTKTTSATITQPTTLMLSTSTTNSTCGNPNGSITLTVSGGVSPYSYHWSNNATTQNISSLAAGTYSVTVTDNNGCTKTTSATINNTNGPSLSETHVNVLCNGSSTGSITLTVSGGTSPYSYAWSNSATTQNISNLAAGTYTVTVTDNNGCTATKSATITQPTAIALSTTTTNSTCGNPNGSITLTVSGGVSPYSYHWSNNASTQNISGLAAGTYSVTVTDNNGCTKTTSATINNTNGPALSETHVNVLCYGASTGSIDLTVSGGTSPYTYAWTNSATTQDISNLAAGTYTVTVTDNNGCTAVKSVSITQPAVIALSTTQVNVLCNGSSTGSITLTVTGGVSPYTYAWSNSATTQNLANLAAGTYTVTVTDANSCTKTTSATITQPTAVVLSTTTTNSTCGNPNGSITLTVSGGVSPYSYHWSNNASTQNISGLAAGTYSVTVTDNNGCTKTTSATINNTNGPALSETHVNVLCYGASTGSIDLTVSGGTSPYTYAWTNSATTQDISNLAAGTYTVTVTDNNGCTAVKSVSITQPAVIALSTTQVNVLCNGSATGSITLTVTGGVSPYTYAWSNSATTQNLANLAAGTYTVTVTDANNCTKTTSATITQPTVLALSSTQVNVLCNGSSTGSITLTVSGGVSPYTYVWSNAATTQNLASLAAGTYTVTVTDANSCTKTTSATITQPTAVVLSTTTTNSTCGNPNGSITLTVSGGVSPYSYHWSNNASTQNISGLAAGTYSVTVTDNNGCTKTTSATINNTNGPALSETHVNVLCYGASTGSIDLTVSGGTSPYTYAWTNSATTQDISNLAAGTYTVTVTDNNGCTAVKSVSITQPAVIALSTTQVNVLCNGSSTGSITLTVTGGVSPYTYAWSNSATTQNLANLAAGTYTVTVTDANNCTKTTSATITQPTVLALSSTQVNVLCNGSSTGSITLTVSGGVSPYTYVWSNAATTQNLASLAAGTYTVTVTDANSCTKTASATITQPTAIALSTTTTNSTCGSPNGSIDLTVSGGVSPYSYHWSNNATTQDISGLAAGTYTVTVTDNNGCTKTTSATINNTNGPALSETHVNVLCYGASTGSIDLTVSGGTSPYTYAWTNSATTQDISGLAAGTYTVTVTDNNGCTAVKSVAITQPAVIALSTTQVNVLCNGSSTGSITLTVTGGVSPYTYAWSNSATTQNLANLAAGTYTVTVTDANNCTKTTSATITQPTVLALSSTQVNVLCNGSSTGSIDPDG